MENKDLKKIIKQMVRESLSEIFCEMHLETIVEGVLKKTRKHKPKVISAKSVAQPVISESHKPASKEDIKAKIKDMVGANDSEWAHIYQDTIEHGHPILSDDSNGKPELVSEAALQKSGLMRDFSKFIK